jgi:CO/xanthine dehydrogenase FAD-binding subunit
MSHFDYHQPTSMQEAISLLGEYGRDAALLAGGTALLIDIRHGELDPLHVVSLWGIPGLEGVQVDGGSGYRFGALVTITNLANALADQPALRGLVEAAHLLGAQQVQNVATLGGNICKASPGADMVPPLLCLDAILVLDGPNGQRRTPLDGFLTGPDQTALRPAEVLTSIEFPSPAAHTGTAFLKVMRRHAVDCSIVAVSARVTLAEDGQTVLTARLGLGAVAPNPFRARQAEELLQGQKPEPNILKQAAAQARSEARPISDVRASADYRSMLIETLVQRALSKAVERAMEGASNR